MLFVILLVVFVTAEVCAQAVGLAPLDRGVSLWLVGDKTMVGVELERFELTWSEIEEQGFTEKPDENLTRYIRVGLTAKRVLFQDVFGYIRIYNQITHDEWDHGHYNGGLNGPEIGFGYWWKPKKKISIVLRQGFSWKKSDQMLRDHSHKETEALRMEEARVLVLVHF